MKYLFIIASILLSRLIPCNNVGGTLGSTSSDSAKAEVNAPLRDMSITSANSYSDLFLDSIALDNYIKSQKLNDSMARELKNFYNVRNYQFAWFNSKGLTEEGRGFWSLYDYANDHGDSVKENKSLASRMDTLTETDSLLISTGDSSFISTELALTKEFIKYSDTFKDYVGFSDAYHFVPVKKMDVMELADSVLNKTDSINKNDSLNNQSATDQFSRPYHLLKEELRIYYNIAQKEGWQSIPLGAKKFSKGKSYAVVPVIKKRLLFTGELEGQDTTRVYNDSLETAIINYKIRHGFDSSATITDSLISDMNIPVKQRIGQILINMNRMTWIPNISSTQLIEVNIPEFMLKVYEGSSKAFDMKVVVGKEGANTTMFSGDLNQLVFSPYWNIPASIVEEEILPGMKADAGYLQKNHMEIVKKNDSLPVIRQVPGPDNSMGKVKFLFPNSYEIFFHDTPAKNLFTKDKRAFSHGCIRLEDAKKLAGYLLKDDPSWTPGKIEQAMNSGKEQFVQVKKPVPVMITYFTTWVDQNGKLNFRSDVYNHDAKTRARMFGTTVALQQSPYIDSTHKDTTKNKI
jgi:murein L,D-transpeptidase YcbB/YkuD